MTDLLQCSFCCKTEREVRKLVAGGGGGHICDACVRTAARIIDESEGADDRSWVGIARRMRALARRLGGSSLRARWT